MGWVWDSELERVKISCKSRACRGVDHAVHWMFRPGSRAGLSACPGRPHTVRTWRAADQDLADNTNCVSENQLGIFAGQASLNHAPTW